MRNAYTQITVWIFKRCDRLIFKLISITSIARAHIHNSTVIIITALLCLVNGRAKRYLVVRVTSETRGSIRPNTRTNVRYNYIILHEIIEISSL